jgi:hypothetical protein
MFQKNKECPLTRGLFFDLRMPSGFRQECMQKFRGIATKQI